ncbi:MAG: glutamine--fructose-6-phosphate transaminase (isomerizing) [Culicoidibacterales bacterium]
MCGIVGIINNNGGALAQTLESLKKLEYRGYDSAGMYVVAENEGVFFKAIGKIAQMEKLLPNKLTSKLAIGHTRWATHGRATVENTHPHQSGDGRVILVHNGIIENHQALREKYCQDIKLVGQTDSEVVANVLAYFLEREQLFFQEALRKLLLVIKGSYALVIVDQQNPQKLYFARNKSPLIISQMADFVAVASDILALGAQVKSYAVIENQTFGEISLAGVAVWDAGGQKKRLNFHENTLGQDQLIDKGKYEHFMQKEMFEQPEVLRDIFGKYTVGAAMAFDPKLISAVSNARKVRIVAAGTSFNSGLVVAQLFEKYTDIEIDVFVASEFSQSDKKITSDDVYFFFSQSGQTADSLVALTKVQEFGAKTVALTNVVTSSLAQLCDYCLPIMAGVEIAVASTKAYVAQITVMSGLLYQYQNKTALQWKVVIDQGIAQISQILADAPIFNKYAKEQLLITKNAFYIGRQVGYALALEAALKLKEISYIQTEGFAAGELKHGTIALIEDKTPVIALITDQKCALLMESNIEEIRARGGNVFTISCKTESAGYDADYSLYIDNDISLAISLIVTTQLIAYYAAKIRECDVDMPRNLAKSVTVE